MTNIFIWAFGVGAMISLFLAYQQSRREKLIICKLSADVCWVVHYLCLGAYGGAIPNFVGIFREIVFVNRENKKWAECTFWPIIFVLLNFILGISTFKTPINILPITASVLVTISLWLKNPVLTKIISLPVSITFLIYDICIGSWMGGFNESIALFSIVISFIKNLNLRRNTYDE